MLPALVYSKERGRIVAKGVSEAASFRSHLLWFARRDCLIGLSRCIILSSVREDEGLPEGEGKYAPYTYLRLLEHCCLVCWIELSRELYGVAQH